MFIFTKRILIGSVFFICTISAMDLPKTNYPGYLTAHLTSLDEHIEYKKAQIQLCVEYIGEEKKNPQDNSKTWISRWTSQKKGFKKDLAVAIKQRQELINNYEKDRKEEMIRQ